MSRRGSPNSRGVTIREGTGERHWYVPAGFVAGSIVGFLYIVYMYRVDELAAIWSIAIVLLLMCIGALATFISIFKDSAYLRGTAAGWSPKWWYFIGLPFAISIGLFFVVDAIDTADMATGISLSIFAILGLVSNVLYLYKRHKYIGVP